jgi:hypothetical protein
VAALTDEVVPHFHNEPGVPVIEIGPRKPSLKHAEASTCSGPTSWPLKILTFAVCTLVAEGNSLTLRCLRTRSKSIVSSSGHDIAVEIGGALLELGEILDGLQSTLRAKSARRTR